MRVRAIDHVTLRVRSVALAKEYYEAVFGLECSPADVEGAAGLRLENEDVHFFMLEESDLDPAHIRAQHLSFAVVDLDAVIAELESRGELFTVGQFEDSRTGRAPRFSWGSE